MISQNYINENITINSGGIALNNIIYSGGTLTVNNGGLAGDGVDDTVSNIIYSGGALIVNSGGEAYGNYISSGGTLTVNNGGKIGGNYISSGGSLTVSNGGSSYKTFIYSGGTLTVNSGGDMRRVEIFQGANFNINNGASAHFVEIYSGGNVNVNSGGIADETFISSGGILTVNLGGSATSNTLYSGGSLTVSGEAVDLSEYDPDINGCAYNNIISSGGNLTVLSVGNAIYNTISSGGNLTVLSGGSATSTTILSGGTVVVSTYPYLEEPEEKFDPAKIFYTTINSGGILRVIDDAVAETITISSGGILNVSGSVVVDITVLTGGLFIASDEKITHANIYGSAIFDDVGLYESYVYSGGSLIFNGSSTSGVTVLSGGSLILNPGVSLEGVISIYAGGNATIYPDTGGAIELVNGGNGALTISGLSNSLARSITTSITTIVTVISGFNGASAEDSDLITLAGINATDVQSVDYVDANGKHNGDFVTLTLKNGGKITMNIIGAENAGYTLGTGADGNLTYEVCFLSGSMIRMLNGEIAVEDLRIGDEVLTYDWVAQKEIVKSVRWVGNKQMIVKAGLPDDEAGYPVRICKDAIADGVPYKDLLITPEHCLFFEGKFVPARMLVNGSSIYYDHSITDYTYYHIETEDHSVIWADGMLTESYLDTGNRSSFKQHGNFVLFNKPSTPKSWNKDASAALTVDPAFVEPLYTQISQRAVDIGFAAEEKHLLTENSEFHLVTDMGDEIHSHAHNRNKYSFVLPEGVNAVYLKSKTSRPCDVIGPFIDDRRQLGLLIGQVNILTNNQNISITNHYTDHGLDGWDVVEQSACRWTNGNALLTLPENHLETRTLIIEVLFSNLYLVEEKKGQKEKPALKIA